MELRTRQLYLKPCRAADLGAVQELWTDPSVRRFLFDDRCLSGEEAQAILERSAVTFQERGYGVWLAFGEGGGPPRGFAGLLESSKGPPNLVVGMKPVWWGQGLGTEAGRAVLDHAFATLGLQEVMADVDEPNAPSIRMLEKLGMTLRSRAVVDGRPLLYYGISRDQVPGEPS